MLQNLCRLAKYIKQISPQSNCLQYINKFVILLILHFAKFEKERRDHRNTNFYSLHTNVIQVAICESLQC